MLNEMDDQTSRIFREAVEARASLRRLLGPSAYAYFLSLLRNGVRSPAWTEALDAWQREAGQAIDGSGIADRD